MVTATREKKECGCGAMIAATGQKMHETSKAHRAWVESQATSVTAPISEPAVITVQAVIEVVVEADPEIENIDAMVKRGANPLFIAKTVRKEIFNPRRWPNAEHPGDVAAFLDEHKIPLCNLPRHVTPSEANTYMTNWMEVLEANKWGKPEWNTHTFALSWSAFLVAQAEAQARRVATRTGG